MNSPLGWIDGELDRLAAEGLRRHPVSLSSPPGPEVIIDGRRVIQLCSNDYLGLAGDLRLRRAAAQATMRWGAGSGASRLVSGTNDLHRSVEAALARFKGRDGAVLFSSGFLVNTGTIPALVGKGDAVFSDELNHASIIDGCRLSGARVVIYRHAEAGDLDRLLGEHAPGARRRLVVTDTVFSMQGDLAPLDDIAEVCRRHGAMFMVDDAHATGLLRLAPGAADVVMSTLSKGLGSAGGFVAGSAGLAEWLRNRARSYVFDTAPAAGAVAAAGAALEIIEAEPERGLRALAGARRLAEGLSALGYKVLPPAAAIVPVIVGEAAEAVTLSARLMERGVFVPAIRPPSVPHGTARLRVTTTAAHLDEHLEQALAAFGEVRVRRPSSPRPRPPSGLDPRILSAGGVFVTGTGTGVGKTVVTAVLARTLGSTQRVGVMKAAQTGTSEGADDLAFVRLAGGVPAERCVVPYTFAAPLAPSVCAELEGRSIEISVVVEAARGLTSYCDLLLVEGAGGLLAPFSDSATMADVAAALGLPVLVVALASLGTLNHTALTVEAALARGLEVLGVVLSRFPQHPGLAEATNPGRLAGVEILGVVQEVDGLDVDRAMAPAVFDAEAWVSPALGGRFDRAAFLAAMASEVAAMRAGELV